MKASIERTTIERLAAGFARSPRQLNALHESDAELLRLQDDRLILAITTDTIAEEIAAGLYRDPYLAGWMIVTVNASDLAAVGAEPLGILVSESIPPKMPDAEIDELQRGIRDASERYGLPILGGDTNSAKELILGATAVGIVDGKAPLTRRGACPGDLLFASGPVGLGSAFAFAALLGEAPLEAAQIPFQPIARIGEGQSLIGLASACMDTSDGVLATLDELMRLNRVGVSWKLPLVESLHPIAHETAVRAGLPAWTMLAGPHGEFELLFTVPPTRRAALLRAAAAIEWKPIELGHFTHEPNCRFRNGRGWLELDTTRIRNLFVEVGGQPERYLRELVGGTALSY